MANSLRCKNCNYYETEHDHPEYVDSPGNVCGNFQLSDADEIIQKRIDEEERERIRGAGQQKAYLFHPVHGLIDITG